MVRGKITESDSDYFRRRAQEERRASEAATDDLARDLHAELSDRYDAMADALQQPVGPVVRIVASPT